MNFKIEKLSLGQVWRPRNLILAFGRLRQAELWACEVYIVPEPPMLGRETLCLKTKKSFY